MWARVDDGWWSHPKVVGLGLAARGLWVSALSWSCHQRKDTVPTGLLALFYASEIEANELVEAGMWHVVEGGYRIHDWAEYQEKSLSEKRAEAGAKGGRKRAQNQANRKQTEAGEQATALAGPSHPDPARRASGRESVTTELLPPIVSAPVPDELREQNLAQVRQLRTQEAG